MYIIATIDIVFCFIALITLVIVTLQAHCIPTKPFYNTWMLSFDLIRYKCCMCCVYHLIFVCIVYMYHVYIILCWNLYVFCTFATCMLACLSCHKYRLSWGRTGPQVHILILRMLLSTVRFSNIITSVYYWHLLDWSGNDTQGNLQELLRGLMGVWIVHPHMWAL